MFEHEIALQELNTNYAAMPKNIKNSIAYWEREKAKVYGQENVDPAAERALKAKSAIIANEIQDFVEKDLPDEEIPNPNNMLSDADKARAKAVGLDENTATLAEIEAKEKEATDKVAKEAADKEAAEKAAKEAADKEAADKAAKEAADKAKAAEEDDFVDGLM